MPKTVSHPLLLPKSVSHPSAWSFYLPLFLVLTAFPVLARVWFDFLHGGSPWRQGDWLINSAAGLVRRGFMGDGMIALGDLTGTNLLAVTIAVQTGLFLALLWLLWVLARDHPNKPLILLLAASPAFLPIFWAGHESPPVSGTQRPGSRTAPCA